jgi:cytochrome b6-f complex iron-sulfur subunit
MSEATASTNDEQVEEKLSVNRQEFLNLAWLASLGFLVLEVSGVVVLFAYPRFKEGEFGGIFTVGSIGELPEKNSSPANFPKVKLWLSNTDEGLIALYKVCPHLGCLYGWSDQDFKFICPCHGSQYEYDGDYLQGPAPRSLDRFAIRIVDGASGEVLAENSGDGYGAISLDGLPGDAIVQIDTGDKELGEVHD